MVYWRHIAILLLHAFDEGYALFSALHVRINLDQAVGHFLDNLFIHGEPLLHGSNL